MKYSIYINQKELAKYEELDVIDGAILNYIYWLCNSKNGKVEKQREDGYTWVSYSQLLKQMPLLRIKDKGAISRRFDKYRRLKLIQIKYGKYKRMMVKTTGSLDHELIQNNTRIDIDQQGVDTDQHDNTNKDNSINIRKETYILEGEEIETAKEVSELLLGFYNRLFDRQQRMTDKKYRQVLSRLKTYTADELSVAIKKAARSDFHRGKNDRGWVADFEYIMRSDENVDKLINL